MKTFKVKADVTKYLTKSFLGFEEKGRLFTNSFVSDLVKTYDKSKGESLQYHLIIKYGKEIFRVNDYINELEKYSEMPVKRFRNYIGQFFNTSDCFKRQSMGVYTYNYEYLRDELGLEEPTMDKEDNPKEDGLKESASTLELKEFSGEELLTQTVSDSNGMPFTVHAKQADLSAVNKASNVKDNKDKRGLPSYYFALKNRLENIEKEISSVQDDIVWGVVHITQDDLYFLTKLEKELSQARSTFRQWGMSYGVRDSDNK